MDEVAAEEKVVRAARLGKGLALDDSTQISDVPAALTYLRDDLLAKLLGTKGKAGGGGDAAGHLTKAERTSIPGVKDDEMMVS